jgi:hypothetical protein
LPTPETGKVESMATEQVFLVHADLSVQALRAIPGVDEVQELTGSLTLVATTLTRSRLYHLVKWEGPPDTPLVVAPLTEPPKVTRVANGAVTWIRDHLPTD